MWLVTGAKGFIGSHLMAALKIARREAVPFDAKAGQDIGDSDTIWRACYEHKIDTIVHLAALADVRKSTLNPQKFIDLNVSATMTMLRAATSAGVKNFILMSSSSVYGNASNPLREDDTIRRPVSIYGATKLAMEAIASAWSHCNDVDVTCLRGFTIYGPGQRSGMAVAEFTRRISSVVPVDVYGKGDSARDYVYVDDAVSAILAASERMAGFQVYNVGTGISTKLIDLLALISQKLGIPPKICYRPFNDADAFDPRPDVSKAYKALGWRAEVMLDEGLDRYIAWFRGKVGN